MNIADSIYRWIFSPWAAYNNLNNEDQNDNNERRANFCEELAQIESESSNNRFEDFDLVDTDEHASSLELHRNLIAVGIPHSMLN